MDENKTKKNVTVPGTYFDQNGVGNIDSSTLGVFGVGVAPL